MVARRWSVVCTSLGSVLLLAGILAGLVNHHVLDGPRFAQHLDNIRRDQAVSLQIGRLITSRVLETNPNLVALRPLIEAAATSLAGSDAFGAVVEASARQAHEFFTAQNPNQVGVQLANLGTLLDGVLTAIAPVAAARIPPDLRVALVNIGNQTTSADIVRLTHLVATLAWLLPLLALIAFVAGVLLAADRVRAMVRTGYGVATAGMGIALVWLGGSLLASQQDPTSLNGALISATWEEFDGIIWWAAVLTAGAGALLAAAASARVPDVDLGALAPRVWGWVVQTPERTWVRALRALALVAVGLGCVLQPMLMLRVFLLVVGWVLVVAGLGEFAVISGARRQVASAPRPVRRRLAPFIGMAVAVALVVGLVGFNATPAAEQIRTLSTSTTACNGFNRLCDRAYNDVAFAATHNAMAAADEAGWFIPEQPTGLIGQLDAGVRALLIDTWYGQATQRPGVVATAGRSYAEALAQAKEDFGPEVVASALRLRESITHQTGPIQPFMCHGLCETGATPLEPAMDRVRQWLEANPREVVTFIIEDNVTPEDTADVMERAGLMPYIHTQLPGQPWPTLGEMIDSGQRLVVMMERRGGGAADPWLLSAFDWVQDTAYTNPTVESLSCALNRGAETDPLFMINNWLSGFSRLVSSARTVNAYSQLLSYAERCRTERGQIPNFIAVNFYNEGDLFRVVNALNGIR